MAAVAARLSPLGMKLQAVLAGRSQILHQGAATAAPVVVVASLMVMAPAVMAEAMAEMVILLMVALIRAVKVLAVLAKAAPHANLARKLASCTLAAAVVLLTPAVVQLRCMPVLVVKVAAVTAAAILIPRWSPLLMAYPARAAVVAAADVLSVALRA